jgi:hypothetical protein
MIYPRGMGVWKAKVETISSIFQLMDVNELWSFLGLCNYYSRIVLFFYNIAIKPLTQLTMITYGFKHKNMYFKSWRLNSF